MTYVVVCNVGDNFATNSLQHSHMRRRLTAMLAPTSIDRIYIEKDSSQRKQTEGN